MTGEFREIFVKNWIILLFFILAIIMIVFENFPAIETFIFLFMLIMMVYIHRFLTK